MQFNVRAATGCLSDRSRVGCSRGCGTSDGVSIGRSRVGALPLTVRSVPMLCQTPVDFPLSELTGAGIRPGLTPSRDSASASEVVSRDSAAVRGGLLS